MVTFQLLIITENFLTICSLVVYGHTVSRDTRQVLSIVDKILMFVTVFSQYSSFVMEHQSNLQTFERFYKRTFKS